MHKYGIGYGDHSERCRYAHEREEKGCSVGLVGPREQPNCLNERYDIAARNEENCNPAVGKKYQTKHIGWSD